MLPMGFGYVEGVAHELGLARLGRAKLYSSRTIGMFPRDMPHIYRTLVGSDLRHGRSKSSTSHGSTMVAA